MIKLLDDSQFSLAEGPLWDPRCNGWVFTDINDKAVFAINSSLNITSCDLSKASSNAVLVNTNGYVLTHADSISVWDQGEVKEIAYIDHAEDLRCNDGSVGPDGKYWFGTMEKSPSGLNGRLYSLDLKGNLVDQNAEIGIPNSFIWLNERFVLISDSFLQKTFKVELLESGKLDWGNREVWLDFCQTEGTPDGGALDEDGNVWLAVWGDASIHQYSPSGILLSKIELKALQPTSCAFGGENMDELLITTATEGMSDEQLQMYPDSGKVMLKKMDVKGKVLPVFDLEV